MNNSQFANCPTPQKFNTANAINSARSGMPIHQSNRLDTEPGADKLKYKLNPPYRMAENAKGRSAVCNHNADQSDHTSLRSNRYAAKNDVPNA